MNKQIFLCLFLNFAQATMLYGAPFSSIFEIDSQSIAQFAAARLGVKKDDINDELISVIRKITNAILLADHHTIKSLLTTSDSKESFKPSQSKANQADKKALLKKLLETHLYPAATQTFSNTRKLLTACTSPSTLMLTNEFLKAIKTTHETLSLEKESDEAQDCIIRKNPLLHSAHRIAADTVMRLIITLFSPKAPACKRMRALFMLNHVHLLGKKDRYLKDFIARTNRYYFHTNGVVKSYDPSAESHTHKRRVKELAHILGLLSSHESHFTTLLCEAQKQGIYEINNVHKSTADLKFKAKRAFWSYTTGFIKSIAGFDITPLRTVSQERITQRTVTKDFMNFISDLETIQNKALYNETIDASGMRDEARMIALPYIEKYKGMSSLAQNPVLLDIFIRYYLDTLRLLTQ